MNYLERLNQWIDQKVANAQEKLANKRLADKARLSLDSEMTKVKTKLINIEEDMEDSKNSKNFQPQNLWRLEKERMLLEKELAYYKELQKELF